MNKKEMDDLLKWVIVTLVALISIGVFSAIVDHDNTDPPDGRSGMQLYTDALTGCQYLGKPAGGLTPRLDRNGQHICIERGATR